MNARIGDVTQTGTMPGAVVPARERVEFFVAGRPVPQGSKRAFVIPGKGGAKPRAMMTEDAGNERVKSWRLDTASRASEAMAGRPVFEGAVALTATFILPRPKGHYVAGKPERGLKAGVPNLVASKPDLSKLIRAVEDALTGIVYRDDAQIGWEKTVKRYQGVNSLGQIEPLGMNVVVEGVR